MSNLACFDLDCRAFSVEHLVRYTRYVTISVWYALSSCSCSYLSGRFLRLYPKEPVPVVRGAVDVPEGAPVCNVLGDEADLVHGVVVQTVLERKSSEAKHDFARSLPKYPPLSSPP